MARSANTAKTKHASVRGNRIQGFFLQGARDIATPRLMLVVAVLTLTVLGIVMVYSSTTIEAMRFDEPTSSYMVSQVLYSLLGVAACLFVARVIPYYRWLTSLLDVMWIAMLVLLIVTAVAGLKVLGAQRWLALGSVSFQPSEFAKVVFILVMSRIVYQMRTSDMDANTVGIRIMFYIVMPLLILYIAQSDLGTTLICIAGMLAVAWLGDVPLRTLAAIVVVLGALAVLAVVGVGYRSDRLSYLHPIENYDSGGYQLSHSFFSFGEGGLFGVGLGNSTEKYQYLPEAETDFIFAFIGEEMGLVGCMVVVALFLVILYSGLKIAEKAPDSFGAMIAGGSTVMLVFQAFLNIACVTGILPTTGKPLPFISSGGSSLVGSYLLIGLILSVSFASGADSGVYRKRREEFKVVRGSASSRPRRADSGARRTGR